MASYAELQVTTNFSFLRGASHPSELFERAAELGFAALGIVDRNSLAGMIRAHQASKEHKIRLVVGCRLDLMDGTSLLVYPTDRAAYSRLCRLLSLGKSRAGKAACHLHWQNVCEYSGGLIAVLLPDKADEILERQLGQLSEHFGDRSYLALTLRRRPKDAARLLALSNMAATYKVATVVTNDVLYHRPERRFLQDVVTCIREKCTIDDAGFKRERFADRYLKEPREMMRLFKEYPDALRRTHEIAERCRFSMDELQYQYPRETTGDLTSQQTLEKYTWAGAASRYKENIPAKVTLQLKHELDLIRALDYAPYFLTVNNIVKFARSKGILCQGRGSAANSAVCFVLGITSIDPDRSDLLFERFISLERREPPDIDVDFEHERREEVIQWVYDTYGRQHAALTAVVSRYRSKGAIRDVGKALGLNEDVTRLLSGQLWGFGKDIFSDKHIESLNLNKSDARLRMAVGLAQELYNFPRHLSQHPGGFVLTHDRLDDLVPIEPAAMDNRQIIEWDKDDIDVLKFMKVDILALGMLSCIKRNFDLLKEHKNIDLEIATIPAEDPMTYDMICKADTIGTFQIESRAQMTMLPRLKPRTFYDLVIEVSLVRPGPIQGGMVHPYLRRREGLEPVYYPSPALEKVLKKTLGVPIFQEQAMSISIECAGFTPSEADQLRRAMATFKLTGGVTKFKEKLIGGMLQRGYTTEFAETVFAQIEGFGSYGFPESHAASFAIIAYASSWLKCHHPDVFCCAILNAYPMGFYAPAQLVRDAKAHGVEVRPIDINHSHWDCTLERTKTNLMVVRLGFKLAKNLGNEDIARMVALRGDTSFKTIEDMRARCGLNTSTLEILAEADAFGSIGLNRRDAAWALKGQTTDRLPLFIAADEKAATLRPEANEPDVDLNAMTSAMEMTSDYANTSLSLRQHPFRFLREKLGQRGVVTAAKLVELKSGHFVSVAGLVLVRQRPMTSSGVIFMTIEDETGHTNLIVWPKIFEQQRQQVMGAKLLVCQGRLQKEGLVIHVIADQIIALRDYMPTEKIQYNDERSDSDFVIKNFETSSRDFH